MNFNRISTLAMGLTLGLAAATSSLADAGHDHGHKTEGYGIPGSPAKINRTFQLNTTDEMRFSISDLKIRKGETIRFVITNVGKVRHEFSLGTEKELIEHNELMKKFPDMVHEEANKVTVDPGQKGEVIWQFTNSGTVHFACLHPGHYEAGMRGKIKVS